MLLQQSAERVITFLLVTTDDYVTAATSKSPTVTISKNGGAFAAITNSVTEIGSGWYKFTLTTTETNTEGDLIVNATATGCAPWREKHQVIGDLADYIATDIGASLSVTERNAIADHVLRRDWSTAEASSGPDALTKDSVLGVIAKQVGTVSASGGTLTVKKADGSTTFYSLTLTTSASAELTTGQS